MATAAERHGAVTAEEAKAWLAQLAEAGTHSTFFWAVTLIVVVGTRPPSPASS